MALGNDHRMCFFEGLRTGAWASSAEWLEECKKNAAAT
jgi:hypothetical protein